MIHASNGHDIVMSGSNIHYGDFTWVIQGINDSGYFKMTTWDLIGILDVLRVWTNSNNGISGDDRDIIEKALTKLIYYMK